VFVRIEFTGIGAEEVAQLDTGSPWTVLDRETAEALALLDGNGEPKTLVTRHGRRSGHLETTTLSILADEGEALEIDAVVFVSRDWPDHTFLGYSGLLERVRFALDPQRNLFYFGPG
jgi:hypothetical protein